MRSVLFIAAVLSAAAIFAIMNTPVPDAGARIKASCEAHYGAGTQDAQTCQIALLSHHLEQINHDRAAAAARDSGEE